MQGDIPNVTSVSDDGNKLHAHKEKVILSMDIKSFYPSIDPVKAASVARKMWENSPLVIENVDYDLLAKYLGTNLSNDEIRKEKIENIVYMKKKHENNDDDKKKEAHKQNKNNKNKNENKNNKKQNKKIKKTKQQMFDDKWARPVRKPSPIEKIKLLGIALERLIIVSMKNHIYTFKGTNRIQKNGGATGLDETGELGDVFMLWWDKMFVKLLKRCEIVLDLFVRFKDDLNIITDKIVDENEEIKNILGSEYISPQHFDGSNENYTAHILCLLANTVSDMIGFTYDTPAMNDDKKLPVLDLKVYLNDHNKVIHEFYEKSSKNQRVILASSALSWSQKRFVHTQEILRRMKNTSHELGTETQNKFISQYLLKMKRSGYGKKFRSQVLLSAKSAYQKIFEQHKSENSYFYRNRSEMISRKAHKNSVSSNWWQKSSNSGKVYTDILFVPPTPNGTLAKLLRKREAELNGKSNMCIKIVEKGGPKIKRILVKSDPFPKTRCDVKDCPFCEPFPLLKTDEKQNCYANNVGYSIECQLCGMSYEGETHRKISVRGREHVRGLRNKCDTNPLQKHISNHHPDGGCTFKLKVTGQFMDALSRQADEGLRIQQKAKTILNSKSEFNVPEIKTITISSTQITDHY